MVNDQRLIRFLPNAMTHLTTLIDRWRTGDEKAAEAIYNLHQTQVYRLAFGLVGNEQDAEEATQDALTYALINIHHFDEKRSQFTTWLHMITVSRCRDILRKRRLPTVSISDLWHKINQKQSTDPTPERQTIQAEERSAIWKTVQALSPPLREAIILRYWGGHTYQEIADIVGCPIRTAQSRIRLAYDQLEKKLTTSNPESVLREIME